MGARRVHGRRQGREQEEPIVRPRADDDVTIELDEQPLTADRAAQYRDWADRLRTKRATAKQRIQGTPNEVPPSYWNTDNVFRENQRVIDEEVPSRTDPLV